MGRIVATEYVSLDGVVQAPGGFEDFKYAGWSFEIERGEEFDRFKLEETLSSEALLLGRLTYEVFAASWPSVEGEFADKFNSMPKYVVSSTLEEPLEWNNSVLIQGNAAEEIAGLKRQPGKNIGITGSVTLVQSLLRDDLIDELGLMVHPIVVGSGKRLFGEGAEPKGLELVDSKTFGTGVVYLTYRPAGKQGQG